MLEIADWAEIFVSFLLSSAFGKSFSPCLEGVSG
jgi:hypothetical protein